MRLGTQESLAQLHYMALIRENGTYPGRNGLIRSIILTSVVLIFLPLIVRVLSLWLSP